MTALSVPKVPRAFIWRRLHSLMGLWFVLFLIEHLLTNSQAALWLGDNGRGFVHMVNTLHNLPYLQAIEITLLGVPILLHVVLGIKHLFTSKSNVTKGDGSRPYLPLKRNYAYTWQRITSWILLVCLIAHVYKFRFVEYPTSVNVGSTTFYLVKIDVDDGLYTVADRLGVGLFDTQAIAKEREIFTASAPQEQQDLPSPTQKFTLWQGPLGQEYNEQKAFSLHAAQRYQEHEHWVQVLEREKLGPHQVIAASSNFGTVVLFSVRDTFKKPVYMVLYTIFVLAACFHAFNGLWAFLVSWGWILKMAAQRAWMTVSVILMLIMSFLGLAAIWGTYWFNLKA